MFNQQKKYIKNMKIVLSPFKIIEWNINWVEPQIYKWNINSQTNL